MGQITVPLTGTPAFYTGVLQPTDTSVPGFLPVAIAGHAYLIDTPNARWQSEPLLRAQADQATEPSEGSVNRQGLWRRSVQDWTLGAGQRELDAKDSDRRRYWTSLGIDPWTPGGISLLNDTVKTTTTVPSHMLEVDGNVYIANGSTLYSVDDPAVDSWSLTDETVGAGSNIVSMTTDGSRVYVALASGSVRYIPVGGGTDAQLSADTFDLIGYANGRLLGAANNVLYEIDSAGARTAVYTHFSTTWTWEVVAQGPSSIYVSGGAGNLCEVYAIGIDDADGSLGTVRAATALPSGECVTAILSYVGLVVLGTNKGVRLATAAADGDLSYGPLIDTGAEVGSLAADGRFVRFAWSDYDSSHTGLGRLDLFKFTDSLAPAYATDLMAATTGAVTDVIIVDGRPCFAVTGVGVYAEDDLLVASGTIDSGDITYDSVDDKLFRYLSLRHEALAGSVVVTGAVDADAFEPWGNSTEAGSHGPGTLETTALTGEHLQVRLELRRHATATTTGPRVTHYTVLAIPQTKPEELIVLPLVLHSQVTDEKRIRAFDTWAEFEFLRNHMKARTVVNVQWGNQRVHATVDGLELRPSSYTTNNAWLNGTLVVALRLVTI